MRCPKMQEADVTAGTPTPMVEIVVGEVTIRVVADVGQFIA